MEALLEEVRSNIDAPYGFLAFTPALEDRFRRATAGKRRRAALMAGIVGLVILQVYMIVAMTLIESEAAHGLLPYYLTNDALVLAAVFLFAMVRTHRLGDMLAVAAMIAISALVCVLYHNDDSPLAYYGLMCYALVPIFTNVVLRLHFRQAAAVTVLSLLFFLIVLTIKPGIPIEIAIIAALLVVVCSGVTLWDNHRADHDERLTFLYLTRERLRAEQTRRQSEALHEATTIDPLTSIANRRGFEKRLAILIETCRREDRALVVLMIDIDHFKAFNDQHGHIWGDTCLRDVAQVLAGASRGPEDLVARLGGGEFGLMMPGLSGGAEIVGFLERLRNGVHHLNIPHEGLPGGRRGRITVSIGCAVARPELPDSWGTIAQRAARSLWQAKLGGRDRWHIAGSSLDAG